MTKYLWLFPLVVSCGYSQKELDAQVLAARGEEQARYDAEMKKMQASHEDVVKKQQGDIEDREKLIQGMEGEVKRLGGDLNKVRGELGDRLAQLANTKTELAATNAEVEQLRKLREQAEKEAAQFRALAERLKSMIDSGQLEVVMRKGRINLKLPDNVLFPSGAKKLKKEGTEALRSIAAALKEVQDRDFLIAGHTDADKVKRGGPFKDNWELSTARAVEVVQLLIAEGVAPTQLAGAGFGEFDPIAANDTAENKAKNRRLEIILMPKLENLGF